VKIYFVFGALHKYRTLKDTIRTNIANLKEMSYINISGAMTIIGPIAKLKFRYEIEVQSCNNEA